MTITLVGYIHLRDAHILCYVAKGSPKALLILFIDYYDRCPQPDQVCGFDGAGIVEGVGNWVSKFRVGDEVFFAGSPIRQGSNAEYQLVDERSVALKPKNLSFVQAVSMPMTYITAFEALVERLEIQPGEKAALLIINGAKGKFSPFPKLLSLIYFC